MLVHSAGCVRRTVVAALCVSALTIVACGDDASKTSAPDTADRTSTAPQAGPADATRDDKEADRTTADSQAAPDGSPSGGEPSGSGPDAAPRPKPKPFAKRPAEVDDREEREAIDAVATLYDALAAGDARGVCAGLSMEAKRKLAAGATQPPDAACVTNFSRILGGARRGGAAAQRVEVKVIKARVRGDHARVTVSFGKRPGTIEVIKEAGAWRVGSPVTTGP